LAAAATPVEQVALLLAGGTQTIQITAGRRKYLFNAGRPTCGGIQQGTLQPFPDGRYMANHKIVERENMTRKPKQKNGTS